jgi:hypothetical protein
MAVRITDMGGSGTLYPVLVFDYMTGGWKAGGYDIIGIPADGSVHRWRFAYDPDAVVPTSWTDDKLRTYMDSAKRRPIEEILAAAQKAEPDATKESIERRLLARGTWG